MTGWIAAPEYRRVRTVLLWVIGLVLASSLVAGWYGLAEVTAGAGMLDLALAELQVMTGVWEPEGGVHLPRVLTLARVVLPLAAAGFAFLLAADLVGRVRGLTRNHTIVVGRGDAASIITARLRRPRGEAGPRKRVLTGAAGDADSLRPAGIRRAKSVVVCGDDTFDSATNITTTRTAMRLARHRNASAHLLVGDPGLALALRARRLAQPESRDRLIRVFTVDELAARHHVQRMPLEGEPAPHILVVGSSAFGRAVIVEFARRWSVEGDRSVTPPITLVAPDANHVAGQIGDRWPFVKSTCELRPVQLPVEEAMLANAVRPYRSYFCDDDEAKALRTALTAATRWRPGPGSIVVRLRRLAAQPDAYLQDFDNLGGALDPISVYDVAAQEILLDEELRRHSLMATPDGRRMAAVDPLVVFAQGIHESYLDDARRRGEVLGSRPALVPWDALGQEFRAANVAQAAAFPRTLAAIRCTVAPRTRLADPFFFRPGEVETLARAEHEHWVEQLRSQGWTYGEQRAVNRKRHNLLVPWEQLSEADRSRNRAIVRRRPALFDRVLEREGLQIVRLAADSTEPTVAPPAWLTPDVVERLAPLVHESFLKSRLATGSTMGSTPAMRSWEELSEDLREANRAQARDIGAKLDLLEATVTATPPARPFELADEEVEMLARYEHDRWVSERIASGWTYGVRDDEAKTHDLLVPWLYLTPTKQELDRDRIRHIPELLESAGWHITRR
jgi:hypothetical protein